MSEPTAEPTVPRENWGTRIGVILAVAGSAVGLGNFLRFPGQAAAHGGGAFMIPYFISFLIVGIPICWAEWTMGREGGRRFHNAPGILATLGGGRVAMYLGAIGLLIPIIIYMYYVYIESWCLMYAYYYATGQFELGQNPNAYGERFNALVGTQADGVIFPSVDESGEWKSIKPVFWFFVVTFIVNFTVIYRGLTRGIEVFCKFAMPLLIIAAIAVAARVLTLPEQPIPDPWHQSLAAALPSADWNLIEEEAEHPETTAEKLRKRVDQALTDYFATTLNPGADMLGYDLDVLVRPPFGYRASTQAVVVDMAEIRAEQSGREYRKWALATRDDLPIEQKFELSRLEAKEEALRAKSQLTEEDEAALASILERRAAILDGSPAGAMPRLADALATVVTEEKGDRLAWQYRSAASEVAELRRTVLNGLGYMWNPDLEALLDPQVWLAATGQIFFSLSVGFGIVLIYASYLKRNDDVVLSGLTASSTNEFCEVILGGLVAIPSTFVFLGTAMTLEVIRTGGTFGLGFVTLPAVFASMPAGQWVATIWFGLLFLAGVTSSLSMLQPAIAFLEEGFGLNRRASVAALGLMTATGSLTVLYFSGNTVAVDTMDFWVGTAAIYVFATIQVIVFGWVIGIDRGFEAAHRGADMIIPRIFAPILKYVTPTYLLVIFGFWLVQNLPGRVQAMLYKPPVMLTVLYMLLILAFLVLMIALASEQWRKQGRLAAIEVNGASSEGEAS